MSLFSIEVFELSRLHATRVHQGNICECIKIGKRVGYSGRKPRAQGTEMGLKQSVGRSCDCFQDAKTPGKTLFLKLVFRRFFYPI